MVSHNTSIMSIVEWRSLLFRSVKWLVKCMEASLVCMSDCLESPQCVSQHEIMMAGATTLRGIWNKLLRERGINFLEH